MIKFMKSYWDFFQNQNLITQIFLIVCISLVVVFVASYIVFPSFVDWLHSVRRIVANKIRYNNFISIINNLIMDVNFWLLSCVSAGTWLLCRYPIGAFVKLDLKGDEISSLVRAAITADIGLTALLALSINFFHSETSGHEDSTYLGQNPYVSFLNQKKSFKLVTSFMFKLCLLFLYLIPMLAMIARSANWDNLYRYTNFSVNGFGFCCWLSMYCVSLLVLVSSACTALNFSAISQWIEEYGHETIDQGIVDSFWQYRNLLIKGIEGDYNLERIKYNIEKFPKVEDKVQFVKDACKGNFLSESEEPIYVALRLNSEGERTVLNKLLRAVPVHIESIDVRKTIENKDFFALMRFIVSLPSRGICYIRNWRLRNVRSYLQGKWRFFYEHIEFDESNDFIEFVIQQRKSDEALLATLYETWPDACYEVFAGSKTDFDLKQSDGFYSLTCENPPEIDVVLSSAQQYFGELLCRRKDINNLSWWLPDLLSKNYFIDEKIEDEQLVSLHKETSNFLFTEALDFLIRALQEIDPTKKWRKQIEQEKWLEATCGLYKLNTESSRILKALWVSISSSNMSEMSEWSLRSVFDLMPVEKKISHLIWIGAYEFRANNFKSDFARNYTLYKAGIESSCFVEKNGQGIYCIYNQGKPIDSNKLVNSVYRDIGDGDPGITYFFYKRNVQILINKLLIRGIDGEDISLMGNIGFGFLHFLLLKACIWGEYEVRDELIDLWVEDSSVFENKGLQQEVQEYEASYPEAIPEIIEFLSNCANPSE